MKKYNRPVVMVNTELAEGVYAASGEVQLRYKGEYYIAGSTYVSVYGAEVGSTLRLEFTDGSRNIVYNGGLISMKVEDWSKLQAIYLVLNP